MIHRLWKRMFGQRQTGGPEAAGSADDLAAFFELSEAEQVAKVDLLAQLLGQDDNRSPNRIPK